MIMIMIICRSNTQEMGWNRCQVFGRSLVSVPFHALRHEQGAIQIKTFGRIGRFSHSFLWFESWFHFLSSLFFSFILRPTASFFLPSCCSQVACRLVYFLPLALSLRRPLVLLLFVPSLADLYLYLRAHLGPSPSEGTFPLFKILFLVDDC